MAKKAKVGFVSLGCSKNLCDTEIMLRHLVDEGYEITPEETEADVVIVNTCAFIESAKKESIDNIIDLGWLKKHNGLRGIRELTESLGGTVRFSSAPGEGFQTVIRIPVKEAEI